MAVGEENRFDIFRLAPERFNGALNSWEVANKTGVQQDDALVADKQMCPSQPTTQREQIRPQLFHSQRCIVPQFRDPVCVLQNRLTRELDERLPHLVGFPAGEQLLARIGGLEGADETGE